MPASWRGYTGGVGGGAIGAAPVSMQNPVDIRAGQSVAPSLSLTTLRPKCGTYAVGGNTQWGTCQPLELRLDPRVTFETIKVTDRDVGGMHRA